MLHENTARQKIRVFEMLLTLIPNIDIVPFYDYEKQAFKRLTKWVCCCFQCDFPPFFDALGHLICIDLNSSTAAQLTSCSLQNLTQVKDREILAVKEELKQQTEKMNTLTQELFTVKAFQEQVTKEKKSLEVKQLF